MFKKLLFFVSFIANALFTLAQSHYPVQVQPTVATPSIYLQDYVDQTNFRVKVSLNDLTKQNFKVRLKMTITGGTPSVVIKSVIGLPLTLNGGEVFFLSDGQLDTLFNPNDLGLTYNSVLTEGAYTFSFEATTDDINQLVVSNIGLDATNALIVLNDPPLLNLPIKGTEIDMSSIGNSLQFGWMPRSFFTSPNRQVKYEIKIVALANPDDNPYQAIQLVPQGTNGQNLYLLKDGLDIPLLNYDPSYFTLASGTVYAWQVRAYEEIVSSGSITKSGARFKNDGYSEVITFSTKDVCPTISMIAQSPNGSSPVRLEWNPSGLGTVNMYEIQYREFGTTLPYTIVRQTDNFLILDNTLIQEGLTYEYMVSVLCNKWQAPVYGGKFKLEVPNCAPPTPIRLGSDSHGDIVFLWDAPLNQPSITGYRFIYSKNSDTEVIENIAKSTSSTSSSFILPVLSGTDFYNIQVDGVCDQVTATGKKQKVNAGDTDFIGTCPIPTPFNLIATRVDKTTTNEAKVVFTFSPLHQSYSLKYWENGSDSTKATVVAINSPTPETILSGIVDDQLYQYRVAFNCSASKISKSGIGMFKVEHASILDPNITPNTGNCFPPAHVAAEARTTTSAKFDWDKSTGAEEYQVLYRVQGSTDNFKIFTTTATNAKIDDLEESKIYEYQIKCRCGIAYSIPSALGTVDLSKPSINANCDTVAFVTALKVTKSEVQMAWKFEDAPTRTSYTLYYKEDSQSWTDQYIQDFNDFTALKQDNVSNDTVRFTAINLKPGTKYNFKLQATCGTDKAQANEVVSATTTAVPSECGSNKSCDRSSTTPIASLAPDEIIQIADYKIKIVAVEPIAGSNPQTYKGNGIAEAPFIGLSENIALQCSFDNLLVNDKACVLKGEVQMDSISAYALDEETRNKVKSYAAGAHAAAAQATDLLNKANDGLTTAEKYANMANDYAQGGGDVGKVKTGGFTADYTTTSTSAPTSNDALIQPAIVKNANNEIYQVDANGNVTKVGKFNDDYKSLQSNPITTVAGVTFKFTANSTAVYPYDAFQPGYNVATMKTHYLLMGTTFCDAKLILPKLLDKVNFTFTGGQSSNLKFVNRDGFEYDYDANAKTINLLGGPASDAQEIMAVYTEGGVKKVIGAILLASYEPKTKKVILVKTKVSSTLQTAVTDAALQTELNKIYGKVGVTYTLTIDDSFINNVDWFGAPNQTTFNGGKNTSLGNEYQDDAKRMKEAYIAQKGAANLDKDAAYLFLVNKDPQSSTTDEALEGKMHLGNQFGFLYNTATLSAPTIAKTLAHELGHGNFVMYHIFDNIYLGDGAKTSDNLMAYGTTPTISINKFQWDLIHDPGVNWGLFVSDDDQEKAVINNMKSIYDNFKNTDGSLTFVTPSGLPITIIDKLSKIEFVFDDEWIYTSSNKSTGQFKPIGTLHSFTTIKGSKTYSITSSSDKFVGYSDATGVLYEDKISYKKTYSNVILGFPSINIANQKFVFNVGKTNLYSSNSQLLTEVLPINKGAGTLKPEGYLINFFNTLSNKIDIYATVENQTKFFNEFLNLDMSDANYVASPKETYYALQVLRLLNKNPYLISCISSSQDKIDADKAKLFEQTLPNDNTGLSTSTNVTANNNIKARILYADFYAKNKYILNSETFFYELLNTLKTFNSQLGNGADVTNANNTIYSEDFINKLIEITENEAFYARKCLLGAINLTSRKAILAEAKTTYVNVFSSKERMIIDVLEATQPRDFQSIINYLKSNNYTVFLNLYNDTHGEENERLISAVSNFIQQTSTYTPEYKTINNYIRTTDFYLTNGSVVVCPDNGIYNVSGARYNSSITTPSFKNNYYYQYVYTTPGSSSSTYAYSTWSTGDPFKLVRVTFLDDYPNLGIKKNTVMVVPEMFVYNLITNNKIQNALTVVRVVGNGIALATAITTVNPSPLLVAGAIFSSVDLIALGYEQYQKQNFQQQSDLITLWNDFNTAFGAILIVKGSISPLASITTSSWTTIVNTLKQGNNLIKLKNLANLSDQIGTALSISATKNLIRAITISAVLRFNVATKSIKTVSNLRFIGEVDGKITIDLDGQVHHIATASTDYNANFLFTSVESYDRTIHGYIKSTLGELKNVLTQTNSGNSLKNFIIIKTVNGNVLLFDNPLEAYLLQQSKIQNSIDKLINNNLYGKFAGASEVEAASLHSYTVSSFSLNRKLNGVDLTPLTEYELKWINSMRDGLAEMRKKNVFKGYIYRGQTLPEDVVKSKYLNPYLADQINAKVTEPAFLSCTKDESVADYFVETSKGRLKSGAETGVSTKFYIKSKSGVDIDEISDYGKNLCATNPNCKQIQQEIFIENGKSFKISNVELIDDGSIKHYNITLEEL